MSNEDLIVELMNRIRDNNQLAARCKCKLKLWGDDLDALSAVLLQGREHSTAQTPEGRAVRIPELPNDRLVKQLPAVDEIATTLDQLRRAAEEIADAQQRLGAMGYSTGG